MQPLISVLIPTFDYGRFLATAVDSVLAQTYPNVEVVVCDNASTDDTAEVAARYANDPRVRYVRNERNIGLVPNFNRALALARGEFVLWLSADDWILPRHLARLHDVFAHEPAIDVVFSTVYFADAQGRVFSMRSEEGQLPFDYVDVRDELPEMLLGVSQMCLPATLFRRALFEELGAMDEGIAIAADWELATRVALAGKRFAYLRDPSACVRVHDANNSGVGFNATGQIVVETVEIVAKFLDHPGMARVRGREAAIAKHLRHLYQAKIAELGTNPFTRAFEERLALVCETLLARDGVYEPARVHGGRISVIVPVVGLPSPALRAIDAAAAQTFPDVEIVVVDQGTAPLGELLRAHPAAERIVHVRLRPPRLAGAARDFGIGLARGTYIAFLDDDNVIAPDHLQSLAETLARTGAHVAASGARLIVEIVNERFVDPDVVAEVDGVFRSAGDPLALGAVANALPLNAILHDRSAYEHAGGFSQEAWILEDFDYLGRLSSVHQLAFSGRTTLEVHVRLALHGQVLGMQADRYLATLDAIYAARDVGPEVEALRVRHRTAVAEVLAGLPKVAHTPPGVVRLIATLSGRNVVPARAAGVV